MGVASAINKLKDDKGQGFTEQDQEVSVLTIYICSYMSLPNWRSCLIMSLTYLSHCRATLVLYGMIINGLFRIKKYNKCLIGQQV